MKRSTAGLVGVITILPFATVLVGGLLLVNGYSESAIFGNQANGFIGPFEITAFSEIALALLIYSVHIQWNHKLTKHEKDRWRMKICFLHIFAMASYWRQYIWNQSK